MVEVTAKLRYLRIAPKKVRNTANVIKGMSVARAESELKARSRRASPALLKLLRSAIANAEQTKRLSKHMLFVKQVLVDPGPSFKRVMPRAMGRATPLIKRTSHVTMVLESKEAPKGERRSEIIREEPVEERSTEILVSRKEESVREEKPKFVAHRIAAPKQIKRPGFIPRIFRRKAI